MNRAPHWLRRLAGLGSLVVVSALGTGVVVAVDELHGSPSIEGDPVASSPAVLFAATAHQQLDMFGPPIPFGSGPFVNDPITEGRAR